MRSGQSAANWIRCLQALEKLPDGGVVAQVIYHRTMVNSADLPTDMYEKHWSKMPSIKRADSEFVLPFTTSYLALHLFIES